MIKQYDQSFVLETAHTSYIFRLLPTKQLEHLYYGKKLTVSSSKDIEPLVEQHAFAPGNTNIYDEEHPEYSLEDMRLEAGMIGKGDIRVPFVEIIHADGSSTNDFLFQEAKINTSHTPIRTLPYALNNKEELEVTLVDEAYAVILKLYYNVYPEYDIITRRAVVINDSDEEIKVNRLMSTQLDFSNHNYVLTTFNGNWTNEMNRHDHIIESGIHINASLTGCSSSRANPFVMLSGKHTTEDDGDVYGLNLIYSGNHYEAVEVGSYGKMRFVSGINPQNFSFLLEEGEIFESPEAVMCFSAHGFNDMSKHMHAFINDCIVRGTWQHKERPILLNSWEANYFKINEQKLLRQAKAAKKAGIELFVMDDGWFGKRDNDQSSLGDWQYDPKKLPHGLKHLVDKINEIGLDFGIWVEPEMVNVDSSLYRSHKEWTIEIPGHNQSEGRHQRILDLCNPEVIDYLTKTMSDIFNSANIKYVKWDMNRTFSDIYSQYLPSSQQQEVFHRYIIGLYKLLDNLTKAFPDILFEGCASGGNRFDLGMLCYMPQIWASDNTDALCRYHIQNSYTYGYPLSVISNHVSSTPNHQTLRTTPLDTRYNIACFGILGYETNLADLSNEALEEIKNQIAQYKAYRHTFQFGTFYRIKQDLHNWCVVSSDQKEAMGMIMQELVLPNRQYHQFIARGLKEEGHYHFFNQEKQYNVKLFGDLINTASPIHIKQDSLAHHVVAKFVKMPGEVEDVHTSGSVLMYGVNLKQAFSANGYSEQVRYFQDFASRLYFIQEESEIK
ncbi:alpha-galactosidase [Sharpea azabuensis]|uniref:alpha-galactosidase n=1 Tax=Sharpea azabuensis TaxID=322505 RepID=UPI00156995E7|nr:alpha-galactosidase [Sharpea azabuensis]